MSETPLAVDSLSELGFSVYEARAYVGLLEISAAVTGYALSNHTGIPQPKVYETLRRLVDKGAVVQVESDPARFLPIAPTELLAMLDRSFKSHLDEAEVDLARVAKGSDPVEIVAVRRLSHWKDIRTSAVALIEKARRHVYLSGHTDQLAPLAEAVEQADARGVRFDVLYFGPPPFLLERGRSLQHASTEGVIYRRHQARHLAAVADSSKTLWALAPTGGDWSAMWHDDPTWAAVVKGYIRHDLYVQQIYADFETVLEERYGPGLERLRAPVADDQPSQTTSDGEAPPDVTSHPA